jgi:hypothetical protein
MKQKIFIIAGLVLLMAVIIFMVKDLFFGKTDNKNPYEYNLNEVRKGDTTEAQFTEIKHFKPGLSQIHGITIDKEDNIFVSGENGVEIYDLEGKPIGGFRINGVANCIHVSNENEIYVGINDHIEKYNFNGRLLQKWNSLSDESLITSIATHGNYVFIADAGAKMVYRYDKTGKFQQKIGQKDPQAGIRGFIIPSPYFDLAIADSNHIWVVNPGRHNLERYTFDGELDLVWGVASMAADGFCGCCNPSNFAVLPDGSFVTSEKAIERIKIYSSRGEFVCFVATPESFTEGTKGLDLAVDSKGEIYVLDPVKDEIRVFVRKVESS